MAGRPRLAAARYSDATGIARSSTPSKRNTGVTYCSNTARIAPPHTPIHSAWRTTAPAASTRPAPCSCETDGVTAITIPDMSSISGQYRLPPRAIPARSVALTRPAMMASATPMPICASCVMMMGTASTPSERNSASRGQRFMGCVGR